MQDDAFDLAAIGLNDRVRNAFQPHAAKGLSLGRVSAVHREQYRIYTSQGEMKAEAIGALLYRAEDASALPAVGDWVAAQPISADEAMAMGLPVIANSDGGTADQVLHGETGFLVDAEESA